MPTTITKITLQDLTPSQRDLCNKTTASIRRIEKAVADVGAQLIKVKAELGHGLFGLWLKDEVGFTPRTAQNYMNVAKAFGGKYETVSHLPQTTVYQLAAITDNAKRAEIIDMITDPTNPPVKEIKTKVREVRDAESSAKIERELLAAKEAREAKYTPEAKKRRAAKEAKEEAERALQIAKREKDERARGDEAVKIVAGLPQASHDALAAFLRKSNAYDELKALQAALRLAPAPLPANEPAPTPVSVAVLKEEKAEIKENTTESAIRELELEGGRLSPPRPHL